MKTLLFTLIGFCLGVALYNLSPVQSLKNAVSKTWRESRPLAVFDDSPAGNRRRFAYECVRIRSSEECRAMLRDLERLL